MRILVDINHPAHVHMYHYFAEEMQHRGHDVLFVCRDKEFEVRLLTNFGFKFINLGKKHKSVIGKVIDNLCFSLRITLIALKFKTDAIVSHGALTATAVSLIIRKPHLTFEDTFNMEQVKLYAPYAKVVFTAMYDNPLMGWNNVLRYRGYKELMYLHPHWFTPQIDFVSKTLGLKKGEKFCIVRFVAWNATHDKGHSGISLQNKVFAIKEFSKYATVYISSESILPNEIEELIDNSDGRILKFCFDPEMMHHAEAAASLIWGESSTMVAEGAVLGTPGVFIDDTGRLFTKDIQEKYGLCYNFTESNIDQLDAIKVGVSILSGEDNIDYNARHKKLIEDNIDVTSMFCWFVENYPESERLWRNNQRQCEQQFINDYP